MSQGGYPPYVLRGHKRAAALRCSAAEDVHETHCETCPYYDLTGEYDEGEWATCDVDRMALDAAAMIEELSGRDV